MVGSLVDSGSDPEMEEEVSGVEDGGNEWKVVENRKRKKNWGQISDSDSENGRHQLRRRKEEFKVMIKFASEFESAINPLKLTKAINDEIGQIENAKMLRGGKLLLFCKDNKQQKKALGIKMLLGKKVSSILEEKKWVRGVITGIPIDMTTERIKKNISGAEVKEVRRLQYVKDRERKDSLSVMIHFDEDKLPERVHLGYMSYMVRPYVPPPLRCFKCQRFGHVAAVCRGKQRCARCGGEHDYGKCEQGVNPKCCNCGGEHSAGYGGCQARQKVLKVQNVRVEDGLTYAEALKRVEQETKMKEIEKVVPQKMNKCKGKTEKDPVEIDKVSFVAFIVEVVNCSAQTESRTERIKIIVRAAEKYLELEGINVEMINEKLKVQVGNTQTTCGGS